MMRATFERLGGIPALAGALAVSACQPVADRFADYGADNRAEPYSDSVSNWQRRLGASVAIVVDVGQIEQTQLTLKLKTVPLGKLVEQLKDDPVCSGVRFSDQPVPELVQGRATPCTGFLIDDQTLLTAKHCIETSAECSSSRIVFDYQMRSDDSLRELTSSQAFNCSGVEPSPTLDYALVHLDRSTGRQGLSLSEFPPETDTPVFLVGHPAGLPKKFALYGNIHEVDATSFTSNLDAYAGNSGSPVISGNGGNVIGLQVRGPRAGDWYVAVDEDGASCFRPRRCRDTPDPWGACAAVEAVRVDAINRELE